MIATGVDEYQLRPFRPGDTAAAVRLARQVEGMELVDPGLERGRRMMDSLCQHPGGWPPIQLNSTRSGAARTCTPHSGGRMAVRGKYRIGFYTLGSPVPWARDMSAISLAVRARLIEAIGEIQVLAVHPQAQRQGVGTALADHAEQTMTAAGARLALAPVIDTGAAEAALTWWQRRGYVFPDRGHNWAMVPWTDRDLVLSYDTEAHLRIGVKALAPQVRLLPPVHARGLGPLGTLPPRVVGLFD